MSAQIRLTLCATLASLLTACALLPLVDTGRWLTQAVVLVAAQAAVGALARRVPLPQLVTLLVQLAAVLLLFVFAFARDVAPLGVLPTPEALAHLDDLLNSGVNDVSEYQTPAPLTDGIKLLLVGGVVLVALVVDALAVTFRSAASAGLPLLGLYSVAAGLAPEDEGSRWLWFLLAAAGFLMLLLAEGKDRLSRWGRVFSAGPQRGEPGTARGMGSGAAGGMGGSVFGVREGGHAPVRTGRRIAGLTLGIALVVPLALPSLGDGLFGPDGPGGGGGGVGGAVAVNPLVSMQDSLNQPENREVLKYKTTGKDNADMYLRIVALDEFDGASWKMSDKPSESVPGLLPTPTGLSQGVATEEIRTSVATAGWYRQKSLPMPFPATDVDVEGDWRFEPEGRVLIGEAGQSASGLNYQVSSLLLEPSAEQLADAPRPRQDILDDYTDIPESLPEVVVQEARRVTQSASNDYERAMALQDWFTTSGGFTYNTQVDSGTGQKAIERFLENKEGFCVHFSFTMAAMSRALGIPARVAVGYVPGTPQPSGAYSVGLKDAHAWPELYFEGVGWVRFEPTPSRGNTPGYAQEQTTDNSADVPPAVPQPTASASAGATTEPVCDARAQRAGDCSPDEEEAAAGAGGGGTPVWQIAALAAGAAVLVLLPFTPMLWRRRLRGRRLSPERDATVRTLAAWQEFLDTAWDLGEPPRSSETPRRAVERVLRRWSLTGAPADTARRLAAAVERALYAPEPEPVPGLADEVRALLAALTAAASARTRARALLLPRSTSRVLWTASAWWQRTTTRYTAAARRLPRPKPRPTAAK